MRTTAERLAAAKRRARELERERAAPPCPWAPLARYSGLSRCDVSLALVMPGITEGFSDTALGVGMAASVFSGRSLGYLVVGLLAFALGVCVTVLCVRLRGHEEDSADEERYDD